MMCRPAQGTTYFTAIAFCLLAACGGRETANSTTTPTEPNGDADSMHVLDSTYRRMVGTFAERFRTGEEGMVLFTGQEIPWDSLAALVPPVAGSHALHIDYGLHNDSLRLAFHILTLQPTAAPNVFHYEPGEFVHDWHGGRFTEWARSAWQQKFQYDPASPGTYFSRVQVERTRASGFVPVDPAIDARSCVLGWELEALQLFAQNEDHPDSSFSAVFSATGRFDDHDTLRQGTVLHLRLRPKEDPNAPARDLLDDSYDPAHLLRLHGADFGTLCPPACAEYLLPPQ